MTLLKNNRYLPLFIIALAPLFWAGNAVVGRSARGVIPPISLSFWRWAIASLILLPFAWKTLREDWPAVKKHALILFILSLTGIAAFNTLQYTALKTTTAINSSLIQTIMPAVIILLSALFFRERINRPQGVGVVICTAGALLVVTQADWSLVRELRFVRGDVIMLIGVVDYALYSVLLKKRPPVRSLPFLLVTFVMGALMLLPLYIWEISQEGVFPLNNQTLLSLTYVGIFPSILAYFCWTYGVAKVGSNRTGLFINLLPVFTGLLSAVFLEESFRWFHLAGMALIFGGIGLFNWGMGEFRIFNR